MEQLTGADLQVVLSLKEGKGFQRVANPTCIVATLDGQSLETDPIEPDSNPCYTTDLVWKADKYNLRKMRSAQEPLKIECFEIKERSRKDRIGYAILSLRTAQIVSKDSNSSIAPKWHKLLSLRNDVKADKPELSLTLTIEEHETYIRRMQEVTASKERIQHGFPTTDSETAVPYLIEKESLIQLGPVATCNSIFLLTIVAGTARNLHFFEGETEKPLAHNYSLWYRVLENDVHLQSFAKFEERLELNEQVLIRIRSSWNVLRNYLRKQPNFLLILQRGDSILGHSELDLGALMPEERNQDSLKFAENEETVLNNRCVLIGEKSASKIGDNEDNGAFLDLQLKLRCIDATNTISNLRVDQNAGSGEICRQECPGDHATNLHRAFSEIDAHRNPYGDFGTCLNGARRTSKSLYTDTWKVGFEENLKDRNPFTPRIVATSDPRGAQVESKSLEAYRCYCLNVNMIAIKLSSSSVRNIEFRFHHPKAEIMSTLYPKMPLQRDEQLRLQDIRCKFLFISAAEEIRHLLISYPPKVSICDVGDETKVCIGQTILDVARLFHQAKPEIKYQAVLYDVDKNYIGTLDVAMCLEDHGPYYETYKHKSDENLGPPIIDDGLVYKIVDELESWKEKQQDIFRVELKRREERHLNRLSEEWQQRREKLESKLACSVEQCKILANSLNKATEDLRTRRLKSLEKEARLIKANEDLQWRYENNVMQVQDASRRLQEEYVSKINSLEERINSLEERKNTLEGQNENLRLENERLRRTNVEQEEEIRTFQKGSLTQDQTASLLQEVKAIEEKLSDTQKDKAYFKEQWGKAVREIHRMKIEHQQAIGVQIKASKEELRNLNLEDVLCADSTALTNDQMLLGEIQKEIDVIKPSSRFFRREATSQRNLTLIDVHPYYQEIAKTHRSSAKSDQQDERLRKLIEERDSLLKTGSYTNDDAVIVKLNAEIRSLLTTN